MSKLFLGHQAYEDLKNIIGPVATVLLAKSKGGAPLYLPKVQPAADETEYTIKLQDGISATFKKMTTNQQEIKSLLEENARLLSELTKGPGKEFIKELEKIVKQYDEET